MKFRLFLIAALALGLIIGWVDSRPGWDDTGITAMAVFLVTALFGAAMPSRGWVWGLAVGGSIFLLNIILYRNFGASLALIISFVGSYAGALLRRGLSPSTQSEEIT